jgi:hypothetical protein
LAAQKADSLGFAVAIACFEKLHCHFLLSFLRATFREVAYYLFIKEIQFFFILNK